MSRNADMSTQPPSANAQPASPKPAVETGETPEVRRAAGATLGEPRFEFGAGQPGAARQGLLGALLAHAGLIALIFGVALSQRQVREAILPDKLPDFVFLDQPGPGGGGGGGGNKSPEPPKQKPKIETPAPKPPAPTLEPPKIETPPPPPAVVAPVETTPTPEPAPAVIASNQPSTSQGTGTNGGAGTGRGSGIGPGQGSGIGPGTGGGFGGGAYQPGNGVTSPTVVREVKPQYTAEAMRAKVQGTVWLQCVVMPDGSVGSVQITKSLDSTFGLDQEAIKAAKQWRFRPGMLKGEPVPVLVTIELTFTLR
jgi:periplasmic protein TonB